MSRIDPFVGFFVAIAGLPAALASPVAMPPIAQGERLTRIEARNAERLTRLESMGDPFRVSSRAARTLAGRATYEGAAAGVYSRLTGRTEATRRNDLFPADTTLTIDFVANGRGAAAGRIHNFAIDGTPIAGNPEITLSKGRVYVLSSNVIHADAGASMTFDGASWDGDWGAALFGNPASGATGADRLPGSVAGAFGVGNGNVWWNTGDIFIGAFGAHRTE